MAMNRRDLLKAIAALPPIASIEVATVKPSDVIVLTLDVEHVSQQTVSNVTVHLKTIWPEAKLLVLDKGSSLKVVRS